MVRGGEAVRSKTDYILGTDRRLFMNVSVRDPRYNSDHYMVMGVLRGGTEKANEKYIAGRRKVPMQVNRRPTREDELFGDLRRAMLKPQPREQQRNAWISEETWRLIDERVSMRRKARAVQFCLVCRDPLERSSSGRRASRHCRPVPSLHSPPRSLSVRRILL